MADSSTEPADAASVPSILNVNVGILGHVDSGKTSLVRALSTLLSTAALDKNPQSQERGITLDLGFSAFVTEIPEHLTGCGYTKLQFTLVDCPGHASLIKTIIGGAQIIDMMILVIDIVKGIQTQTAECLVVGEITTDNLIVVLNKVDLLPEEGRDKEIERITGRIRKVLASTKFAAAPFVVLSASPGGTGKLGASAPVATTAESTKAQSGTVSELVSVMRSRVQLPHRDAEGPFLFAIDHCFPIKGQGTVITGTVLSGSCKLNDLVELPELHQEKKVKSMQMFRKPVSRIKEGDRAGICVAGLDASLVERGLACTPGTVVALPGAVALVRKVRFFKGSGASESKFHVTIGHSTVMATAVFFGAVELAQAGVHGTGSSVDATGCSRAALSLAESGYTGAGAGKVESSRRAAGGDLHEVKLLPSASGAGAKAMEAAVLKRTAERGIPSIPFVSGAEYEWQAELLGGRRPKGGSMPPTDADLVYEWQWAALQFDSPVLCPLSALVIGSHLDSDIHANACRLAFYGRLAQPLASNDEHELRALNLYKRKVKVGSIDRIDDKADAKDAVAAIGKSLFKKETDMSQFVGLTIYTKVGQATTIESAFGKSGKFKITFRDLTRLDVAAAAAAAEEDIRNVEAFPEGLKAAVAAWRQGKMMDRILELKSGIPIKVGDPLFLRFKKYLYEKKGKEISGGKLVQ